MHRSLLPLIGFLSTAVLWLCLSGCSQPNTFVAPPPPEVTVAAPDVETVTVYQTAPGRLQATDVVEIRARVSGYLELIAFEDGQRVEQGQALSVIEPEPYRVALQAARAELDGAKAKREIATTAYDRRKRVFDKSGAVSQIDVLEAKADLDVATAAVLAAESAVTQAALNLSYTTNRAPVDGRVSRKRVSEGNLVGGGEATLITTLVVEDPIYLYFNASERQLLSWIDKYGRTSPENAPEAKMQLRLANGTVYPHKGQVNFLDNRVDPETGTIEIRAIFPNNDGVLIPGLYADLLAPDVRTDAVLVPDLCIQRDIGGSYVLLVGAEDKVESRYVTMGPKVGDRRIIEDGLGGTEQVIVRGLQRARPGIPVTPVRDPNAAAE